MNLRKTMDALFNEADVNNVLDIWTNQENVCDLRQLVRGLQKKLLDECPPNCLDDMHDLEYNFHTVLFLAALCLEAGRILGRSEAERKKVN